MYFDPQPREFTPYFSIVNGMKTHEFTPHFPIINGMKTRKVAPCTQASVQFVQFNC